MRVGEMGQIIGEMGVGKTGTNRPIWCKTRWAVMLSIRQYTVKNVDKKHAREISRHKAIRQGIRIVYREISRHKAIRRSYI